MIFITVYVAALTLAFGFHKENKIISLLRRQQQQQIYTVFGYQKTQACELTAYVLCVCRTLHNKLLHS